MTPLTSLAQPSGPTVELRAEPQGAAPCDQRQGPEAGPGPFFGGPQGACPPSTAGQRAPKAVPMPAQSMGSSPSQGAACAASDLDTSSPSTFAHAQAEAPFPGQGSAQETAQGPSRAGRRHGPCPDRRGPRESHWACAAALLALSCSLAAPRAALADQGFSQIPLVGPDGLPMTNPMIIALGGDRGPHPLYTLEAYKDALQGGATTLECKVGMTADGEAVCCPGLNVEYVSDVRRQAAGKLAGLYTSNLALNDKEPLESGWFIFNFTMPQLAAVTLVGDARHPRSLVNGRRSRFFFYRGKRGRFAMVRELLELATTWASGSDAQDAKDGAAAPRHLRIILEPLYAEFLWVQRHIATDNTLLDLMAEFKLMPPTPAELLRGGVAPPPVAVHIQSREPTMLKYLRHQNPTLPLIQVLDIDWDQPDVAFPVLELKGPQDEWREKCWDEIATYAWAVAASKDLLLPRNSSNYIAGGIPDRDAAQSGPFLSAARARNLSVLIWSFCEEVDFPMAYDFSHDPYAELAVFVDKVGVDGVYTSCPDLALRFLDTRACLDADTIGIPPPSPQGMGLTDMITIVLFVLIAVLPMGLGLLYAVYKWRESEQYLMWQEFSTGMFSSEAWAGVGASRSGGGGLGSVARPQDAGLVMAAMGPSLGELERVPLTEEEFEGTPRANTGEEDGEEVLLERTGLLVGGEGGEGRKKKGHSSGTWRMRRGADWNSDDAWK